MYNFKLLPCFNKEKSYVLQYTYHSIKSVCNNVDFLANLSIIASFLKLYEKKIYIYVKQCYS